MPAWIEHCGRREKAPSQHSIKERQLTTSMLRSLADESSPDPEGKLAARDNLWRTIVENADGDTMPRLLRLTQADQEALLDYLVNNLDMAALEEAGREKAVATLLTASQSWLDDHEEKARYEKKKARLGT
jgi:hypothetical protein